MKIIVGLGNPGKEYETTRHNVGFMFLDYLEEKYNFKIQKNTLDSKIEETVINGEKVVFAKPQTFMNLSGNAVVKLKNWYKVDEKDILIIFDDIDIPFGETKCKLNGSGGTHNGMKNIVQMMSTTNIARIKIGIGGIKNDKQDLANFVLSKFSNEQIEELNDVFDVADKKMQVFLDKNQF